MFKSFIWPRPSMWREILVAFFLASIALAVLGSQVRAAPMRSSWYGGEMHGRTADGGRWNPMGLSAAHRTLPLGSHLRVCFRSCATVVVSDRGPASWTGRSLDLSRGAARAIGLERVGVATIEVERLD